MKLGAFHYLRKPMEPALIEETLWRAVEHGGLRRENAALRRMLAPASTPDFVGESPAIRAVLALAQKAAAGDSKVVILGESGTGKGVLARRIHEQGRRRQKAFLDVHCGAMAHELLESELFGHERGAFTGAVVEKPGLFELADGGTLFLDEFAEMSPEMQSKLLKVLDHGELRRVGGVRTITVDVRVIVATNRDVDELVKAGRVREDLLHRVDVIRITMPPLRERPEDIPRFVTHVLTLQQRRGLGEKRVTPQAMRVLQSYAWPGNVRELANTIERLLILSPRATIDVDDLPENLLFRKPPAAMTDERYLSLAELERRHILRVLETTGGNMTAAAKKLGVDRGTLHRKMQQWQGHGAQMGSA
jgi:DNA-binding NtrC family response regulator